MLNNAVLLLGFRIHSGIFASAVNLVKVLTGPKYDGKYFHKIVRKELGDTKLHQTLTNVVIPTFDIKKLEPTIFSSYQVVVVSMFFCLLFLFNGFLDEFIVYCLAY
jgi:hypothetical protein